MAAVIFAAYATISVARFERLANKSWDTAIFTQIVTAYSHFSVPIVDLKGVGFNAFGDHFSPLLVVFGPFYRLFPTPVTLLVGQALLVAVSVVVVMRAAIKHVSPAAGVALGVAYGLSWGLQTGINSEFHEYCLAVPLLALAGAAYLDRRWVWGAVWSAGLLLVKEDLGLMVVAIGVVALVCRERRWGIGLVVAGAVGFVLTTVVIIPAFNPTDGYDYWRRFSSGSSQSLDGRFVSLLSDMVLPADPKLHTLLLTFAITGFLALRSPFVLLAVPNLVERFAGDVHFYWGTDWHYSMPLMPIMFIAVIDAIVRTRSSRPAWMAAYARQVPAVAVAVALVLCLQFPVADLFKGSTYQPSPLQAQADAAMALIPDGTSVETDIGLLDQLAADHHVYFIGDSGPVAPDYVLIDGAAGWSAPPNDAARYAMQLHPGTTYRNIYDEAGYELAKRVG
ncbi:MAG: DUF2079 domain-containing protein [Nocardioidaceae bacterium]